jgi:hypothetical protein
LTLKLPGSTRETVLQATPAAWVDVEGNLKWATYVPDGIPFNKQYLTFITFAKQLKERSGLAISISGWRNPQLQIGSSKFQLGSDQTPATPGNLYLSLASQAVSKSFSKTSAAYGGMAGGGLDQHAVRINAPVGMVYAIAETYLYSNTTYWDVAQVASDGVLYFRASHSVLEFTRSPRALEIDVLNKGRPSGYGSGKQPAKALLIRITPDLQTHIELPARVRSIASR